MVVKYQRSLKLLFTCLENSKVNQIFKSQLLQLEISLCECDLYEMILQ